MKFSSGGLVVASLGLGQINREDSASTLGHEFAQDTKQGGFTAVLSIRSSVQDRSDNPLLTGFGARRSPELRFAMDSVN